MKKVFFYKLSESKLPVVLSVHFQLVPSDEILEPPIQYPNLAVEVLTILSKIYSY